jgi:hypothetical protein
LRATPFDRTRVGDFWTFVAIDAEIGERQQFDLLLDALDALDNRAVEPGPLMIFSVWL